jgi:hypothetical protein
MIFQSLMGLGKLRCDNFSGTTQGQDCTKLLGLIKDLKILVHGIPYSNFYYDT